MTETAAALVKHFGQEKKWNQEQNDIGGAFFIHPGNRENPEYREKKSSPQTSPLCGSDCTLFCKSIKSSYINQGLSELFSVKSLGDKKGGTKGQL